MDNIQTRFTLLKDANIIDQQVYQGILSVAELFQQWKICIAETQVEMLLTHLAMALMRLQRQDHSVKALSPEVMDEITCDPNYPRVLYYHNEVMSKIYAQLPALAVTDAENSYLVANIYSLILAQPDCFELNTQKNED